MINQTIVCKAGTRWWGFNKSSHVETSEDSRHRHQLVRPTKPIVRNSANCGQRDSSPCHLPQTSPRASRLQLAAGVDIDPQEQTITLGDRPLPIGALLA